MKAAAFLSVVVGEERRERRGLVKVLRITRSRVETEAFDFHGPLTLQLL